MENNYINDALLGKISREQNVIIGQIRAVLELIEGGATVPFIARYRKEVTGNLDEEQIRAIYQEWDYGQKLAARKEDVMRLIEEKGKLTDEIKMGIINATKLSEIEDIYRPFKEKKKTRATDAKKKGLEPLAEYLLSFPLEGNVEEEASKYVTNLEGKTPEEIEAMKKEGVIVKNTAEAIQGAKDIIAEMVSDEPKFRAWIRENFENEAKMKSEVKEDAVDEKKVYEMYYNYEEPLKTIKLHRILALNRAEDEKVVKVSIVEDYAKVLDHITGEIVKAQDSITAPYVKEAAQDGYDRLIKPAIVREIRGELKDKAEDSGSDLAEVKKSIDVKLLELPSETWAKVSFDGVEGYIKTSNLTSASTTPNIVDKNRVQRILLKVNIGMQLNKTSTIWRKNTILMVFS